MPDNNELPVLLNLQQVVLDSNEEEVLLQTLLNSAIRQLPKIGLDYVSMSAVFFDTNHKITAKYTVCKEGTEPLTVKDAFLEANEEIKKKLLANELVISGAPQLFLQESAGQLNQVKSVLLSPVRMTGTFIGSLILAADRPPATINAKEYELIESFTNFVALAYRLQDTQTSLTNITEEVYKANAKLHQLDKLKDDFVSVASHELRTPMTAIKSYLWMALNKYGKIPTDTSRPAAKPKPFDLPEDLEKYMSRAYISVERLINLVNDMLNISRIESGRIALRLTECDLIQLAQETIDEVQVKAAEKNLKIKIEVSPVHRVLADRDKIHEVYLNLLGNALKFTPNNGTISVSFAEKIPFVYVSVTDTGVGISLDGLSHLFTKFGRLDSSYVAATSSGGTGLGLFICKSLINIHKGQITASSQGENTGATLTFSLPIVGTDIAKKLRDEAPQETADTKELEKTSINYV